MSDMLSIGASGLRAYQTALGVVADNIANAGNAGYSRRVVTMREIASANGPGEIASRQVDAGNGVITGGIIRSGDAFRTAAVRSASSDLARTETGSTWMTRVQSVVDRNALGSRLTGFFGAAQTLAADPTSITARTAMLEAGATTAQAFQATGSQLDAAMDELDSTARETARQLSTLSQSLAAINDGIARNAPRSSGHAALSDQRDQVIDQMSALADIAVQLDDNGRATVRMGGTGGPVLIAGNEAGSVTIARSDGEMAFAVRRQGAAFAFGVGGGVLAGLTEGARSIADARALLDEVAGAFTTAVNTANRAGDDLDAADGDDLFTVGDTPTDIALKSTDPRKIAAAARDGGIRDASNLAVLQQARRDSKVEESATAIVAGVAGSIEARATVAAAQTAIRDAAVAARDQVSGVDLDSEAVDLMRFQQAYSATSRVIQAARETIQTLLDIR